MNLHLTPSEESDLQHNTSPTPDAYLRMRESQLDEALLERPSTIAQEVEVHLIKNLSENAPWILKDHPYIFNIS